MFSSDTFWHNALFSVRFLAQCLFPAQFLGQGLFAVLNLAECPSKNRLFNRFAPKLKKPARAQAAFMPATVGRNARLRAYSAATMLGPPRSLVGRQRGFEACVRNDLNGCRQNRLGNWEEQTSCVAFSVSIQSDC